MAVPAVSSAWTYTEDSLPSDFPLADSVQRWRSMHYIEIKATLTEEQRQISLEIVRGALNWAYSYGNWFDADEFLDTFADRDDSVYVIRYPDGGLGFVIRGAYLRIQPDRSKSSFFSDTHWPDEGRWFAEIGCGSHSEIFYFDAVTFD